MLKSGFGRATPGNRSEMMPSNSGMSCRNKQLGNHTDMSSVGVIEGQAYNRQIVHLEWNIGRALVSK